MTEVNNKNTDDIEKLYNRLHKDAEASGYHLNPDIEFTKELIEGLLTNEKRYGYMACPCRLSGVSKDVDRDIICPCDYRDADLDEYDSCYCALYVSNKILSGEKKAKSIPERRYAKEKAVAEPLANNVFSLPLPVLRCKVCGYLCAREAAPETCPICKAKGDRFERFI